MEEVTLKDVLNVVLDVKQEINEVKNELREDMKVMKQDMEEMKVDIKIIRWEQSDTVNIVKAIINETGEINKKINAIERNNSIIC